MKKSKVREKLQSFIHNTHKFFFEFRYKQITELLVPDLLGRKKIKLGREGDGTYILPENIIEDSSVLLALGIADDISFEEDFLKLYPHSTVLAFDPSIQELPQSNSKIIFESKGVGGRAYPSRNIVTIKEIIEKSNIKVHNQLVIKMDIEGWEWGIFEKLNLNEYNIPVIVIEFHMMQMNTIREWLFFPFYFYKRYNTLKKIFKQYYIFHLHANNYGYSYFKKFTFPWLFEITLINKKLFEKEIRNDVQKFNLINCVDRKDIQYPFFK